MVAVLMWPMTYTISLGFLYYVVLLAGVAGALVVLNRLLCRVVQVKLLCMVDFDAR